MPECSANATTKCVSTATNSCDQHSSQKQQPWEKGADSYWAEDIQLKVHKEHGMLSMLVPSTY